MSFTAVQFQNSFFVLSLWSPVCVNACKGQILTSSTIDSSRQRQLTMTLCREILSVHFLIRTQEKNTYNFRYDNNAKVFERVNNPVLANTHN